MQRLRKSLREFCRREDGPTATEYAAILAMIAIVCLVAVNTLGRNARSTFNHVANSTQDLHPIGLP
jgi:pilus assembly protein Flp/PilA